MAGAAPLNGTRVGFTPSIESVTLLAAQQRQRPDAEIVAGQVSRSSPRVARSHGCVVKSYLMPRCGETG
jgi:hypothetical protein